METVAEIIEKIKTDQKRRNFFKDKLRADLKKLGISCQEEKLNQYLIEAINTFHANLPIQISSHILKYTKEEMKKEENKQLIT